MKKFLFVLMGVFVVIGAFAAGENVPTSKSYVDSKLGEKQDIIPKNDGAPRAIMNTGVAGEYGTKGIYDANGEYAAQQNNLVDAATMNAGVQNAIDSEFQCIEWLDPNDHSSDCLLFDVFGSTGRTSSKNLFDLNAVKAIFANVGDNGNKAIFSRTSNGLTLTVPGEIPSDRYYYTLFAFEKINKFRGKTLTVSAKTRCENGGRAEYFFATSNDDGTVRTSFWRKIAIPEQPDASMPNLAIILYATAGGAGTNPSCTYYDIMVEEGTSATEYEPYKNLYLPAGE